ncbi:MAG TPA: ParB/RepB/Spo0J family partition protein [Gemmatimonadaceae bacterium]|nr:ParB/RepB/Spo0J family partition protein [Gemmatimonadaceae bacterium]
MSAEKPRRLGRGLEALIGATQTASVPASDLQQISTARIKPNPYQPRREFDPEALAELEASIRANGLLQPITVRRKGDSYELVAGERRLRAVTNLQWKEVPAVVRDFDDQMLLVLALVENLQRSDLNAVEEARGYQRLLGEFSLTHQEVAEAVGKDRSTITNLLRVLTLPDPIQRLVESGKLSAGHARALAGIADEEAIAIADHIVANGLSVRQTEQRVRQTRSGSERAHGETGRSPSSLRKHDPAIRQIEDQLRHYLQTDVQIELNGDAKGAIRMSFYSPDDLERLMELILKTSREEFR